MEIVINLLRGVAIGLANIIPGVSGGTMTLVLGIYNRLINAIGKLGPQTVKCVFGGPKAILEEIKRIDAIFLGSLAVGALVAIVSVAKLLTWLLLNKHDPTYGFFFGLVLASVVVPYRMIKHKGAGAVVAVIIGIVCVVALSLAMSGEERLASAQKKAAIKAAKAERAAALVSKEASKDPGGKPAVVVQKVDDSTTQKILFFLGGAVAIAAMILPGISGSFMLLVMGIYFDVLACITGRQFVMLGILAAGCLIGLIVFTKLLKFLLDRYADITMAYLLGLVVGSLYAIWPFKTFGMAGDKRVDMDNILPAAFGGNEIMTVAAALAGMAIVAVFVIIEIKQNKGEVADA